MMVILAGFTSYDVLVKKVLSITYITGHNWTSLLSEYNLKPYDELQFVLGNTPQLVLLSFRRSEEKDWIHVMEPSKVRKMKYEIIVDQRRSLLSRTSVPPSASDRAPAPAPTALALALTAAAAQSNPREDWVPTVSMN